MAVLAGVLVVGIGIGSAVTSTTTGDQGNIASSQQLDMAVPDPEFCRQWGASAFVMDIEMYTTLNPSSSFVTQPTLQPGCVIRRENWSVLRKEGAITAEQERECKQRMNTFAYIGSVRDKPVVRCVYQTDISQNKFLTRGVADDAVGVTPEGRSVLNQLLPDRFRHDLRCLANRAVSTGKDGQNVIAEGHRGA